MQTTATYLVFFYTVALLAAFPSAGPLGAAESLSPPGKPIIEFLKNLTKKEPESNTLDPYSYEVFADFDADRDLPTEKMKLAHKDWWVAYQNLGNHYQTPPSVMFSAADINNSGANGTYTIGRHGGDFLNTLTELIRTTGDPKALEELTNWSKTIRSLLKDHDGRGYKYFQYTAVIKSNPEDNRHNLDDTNWLDEQMLGGVIAHIAHVMHVNRSHSSAAASEADFWFTYLDENWLPKWRYRTSYGTSAQYTPAASLNLQNAVNWDGGIGGSGGNAGDIVNWGGPDYYDSSKGAPRFNDISGLTHKFPVHMFAHPYIMSIQQFLVMGQYFQDMGKAPVSAHITGTAKDYLDEAKTRHDWWQQKVIARSNGSIFWPHFLTTRSGTQRTDAYSQYVAYYVHVLHWMKFEQFADDDHVEKYAKTWYSGNKSDSSDVYDPDNITTMKGMNDGSGGDIKFMLMFAGLLGCWESTGTLTDLNNKVIISPTKHNISANTTWHHNIHQNTILSCEAKNHISK